MALTSVVMLLISIMMATHFWPDPIDKRMCLNSGTLELSKRVELLIGMVQKHLINLLMAWNLNKLMKKIKKTPAQGKHLPQGLAALARSLLLRSKASADNHQLHLSTRLCSLTSMMWLWQRVRERTRWDFLTTKLVTSCAALVIWTEQCWAWLRPTPPLTSLSDQQTPDSESCSREISSKRQLSDK